jgi:hypothetical protein
LISYQNKTHFIEVVLTEEAGFVQILQQQTSKDQVLVFDKAKILPDPLYFLIWWENFTV